MAFLESCIDYAWRWCGASVLAAWHTFIQPNSSVSRTFCESTCGGYNQSNLILETINLQIELLWQLSSMIEGHSQQYCIDSIAHLLNPSFADGFGFTEVVVHFRWYTNGINFISKNFANIFEGAAFGLCSWASAIMSSRSLLYLTSGK